MLLAVHIGRLQQSFLYTVLHLQRELSSAVFTHHGWARTVFTWTFRRLAFSVVKQTYSCAWTTTFQDAELLA